MLLHLSGTRPDGRLFRHAVLFHLFILTTLLAVVLLPAGSPSALLALPFSGSAAVWADRVDDHWVPSVGAPKRPSVQATFAPASGTLTVTGGASTDTLQLRGSGGVVTLTTTDATDAPALPAIDPAHLRAVVVAGASALILADLPALPSLLLQSGGPVTLETPLTVAGSLSIAAERLTLAAPIQAAHLDLSATGLLDLTAGANLTVNGPTTLHADALVLTGDLTATAVHADAQAILHSGAISAPTIELHFATSYQATAASRLDTSGASGGVILLDGGRSGQLFSSGTLLATGAAGTGGQIDLLGRDLVLVAARVDASGATGGGQIRVGGEQQGRDPKLPNAASVTLDGATLRADALAHGSGGRVIVWADGTTAATGDVSARGGATIGDGGFVEVSGKQELRTAIAPDVTAPAGAPGAVLFDPKNLTIAASGVFPQFELRNPTPNPGDVFGNRVHVLSPSGHIIVTDPVDDVVAFNAGAVYLFDGLTGALLSTLTGTSPYDEVGSDGVTALSNGNYVVRSPNWDNGAVANAGAVTWGDGTTGISGTVTDANSLVGISVNDRVGSDGVTALSNGNYVVISTSWDNGAATEAGAETWDSGATMDVGAVTWGNGTTGISGTVTEVNSLVGISAFDRVGSNGVTVLSNGNYVVRSQFWDSGATTDVGAETWDNGAMMDVGAVTWGNGTSGITGPVSVANSLVGTSANDFVGSDGVTALSNGNYVVRSQSWDNGTATDAGAVTWGNGTTGITGPVSAANSLVGTSANDFVGSDGVTALSNGNYVVASTVWNSGAMMDVGAVTWGNGTTGIAGPVSAANSLVGTTVFDRVGRDGVTALSNGNYVVRSSNWDNGTVTDAGAVTWGDGTTGISGVVTEVNSLVGTSAFDQVGFYGVTALSNGNYVVRSPNWDNGTVADAGAVTWGNGTTGITGPVSAANSLVGTSAGDQVGSDGLITLSNGNYVVISTLWDNGAATEAGAVTWGDGTSGITGPVSAANSLAGTTTNDRVGSNGVTALSNGNYVVRSPNWDNGAVANAGAATWGDGTTGIAGLVSAANSLVGTSANDRVGSNDVTALSNGNYVVRSQFWDNGAVANAGAVTWGNGTSGITGPVSSANSLVGTSANDFVGSDSVTALSNGNYVVASTVWNSGVTIDVGAVTWGNGTSGITGPVSSANSLVGTTIFDRVGRDGVTALSNGNYAVRSQFWDNGATVDAGAVTWGDGTTGISGTITDANSLLNTGIGSPIDASVNAAFVVRTSASGRVVVGFGDVAQLTYARAAAENLTITPERVAATLATGAALTLQASNDLTLEDAFVVVNPAGSGGALTLQAGRSVILNANLASDGSPVMLIANDTLANGVSDAQREAGAAVVQMAAGTQINAASAAVLVHVRSDPGKTHNTRGAVVLADVTGLLTVQGAPLAPGGDIVGRTTITGDLSLADGMNLTVTGIGTGQFDQVQVSGAVNLAGPLTLSVSGYVPSLGDSLLLIDNAGSDPVSGMFTGLPEGTVLTVGSGAMLLSYAGGDGNDVVLTTAQAPSFTSSAPPDGTYGASYSHTFTTAGAPDLRFQVTGGTLPPGLSLDAATGVLSGTPTQVGTFASVVVEAVRGDSLAATQTVAITIAKAPLSITVTDAGKVYGADLPALSFSAAGFVLGDTVLTTLTGALATTATAASDVGTYPITQGTLAASNYTLTVTPGTLTVTKASLTVTVDDQTMVLGEPLPELTASYAGFVNGDTAASLDPPVTLVTTATADSPAGTYPIMVTGGANPNYTITRVAGTLTVRERGLSLVNLTGATGRPGSFFSFEAGGFARNALLTITVDERVVLRRAADATGKLRFGLFFAENSPARAYVVKIRGALSEPQVQTIATATTEVTIAPDAPLRERPADAELPTANALLTLYLPLIVR